MKIYINTNKHGKTEVETNHQTCTKPEPFVFGFGEFGYMSLGLGYEFRL